MYGEGLDPLFPEGLRALSFAAIPESMKDQADAGDDEENFHTFSPFDQFFLKIFTIPFRISTTPTPMITKKITIPSKMPRVVNNALIIAIPPFII